MIRTSIELLIFAILGCISALVRNWEALVVSIFFFFIIIFVSESEYKSAEVKVKKEPEKEETREKKRYCVTCERELPSDVDSDQCPNCEIEDAGIAMVVED